MARYHSRRVAIDAVQFTGTNLDAVCALAPADAGSFECAYRETSLMLRSPGRPVRIVHEGDWVSWDGQSVTVHSDDSFGRFWDAAG